jgi:hypothetical protein
MLHVQVASITLPRPRYCGNAWLRSIVKLQSGDPILIEISAAASTPTQLDPTCSGADVLWAAEHFRDGDLRTAGSTNHTREVLRKMTKELPG